MVSKTSPSLLVVGCGDVGRKVAAAWQASGYEVTALARSEESAAALAALGIRVLRGDLDDPQTLPRFSLPGGLVYYFAPPPTTGRDDPRMSHFLATLDTDTPPARIVYISTSGVYGDRQGAWVDERAELTPHADRAWRRLSAERAVQAWGVAHGSAVIILRVAGIYGPGRLPEARLRKGTPTLRESECGYTNRIHIEDLVVTCLAAAERGRPGGVYNVADDEPGTMTGYFHAVADALGLPRLPEITMEEARRVLSPAMLSYLTESRRLDNRKLREELGVVLRYPGLRSGLAAITEQRTT